MADIQYTPPPTIREFIKDYLPGQLFYDFVVGPYGSGKTTGLFFKLVVMAKLQAPGPDGIRRTRAVVVRNTLPQLRDTTLSSWNYWFKPAPAGTKAGTGNEWKATEWKFILRFDDVECEVLFRPLDTADDVARVLSLEITFALIDEFVEIPRAVVDALSGRCGRYPPATMGGATNWGVWGSSNPSTEDNWWHDYVHDSAVFVQPAECPVEEDRMVMGMRNAQLDRGGRNARYFLQPSGFSPEAENVENLPGGQDYYVNQAKGKSTAWISQFLKAEWGFSISGKPVVQSFRASVHLSKQPLEWSPHLLLVGGFDPGLGGSAMVFGQEDLDGRLLVLGELVQQGFGAKRFMTQRLEPYLRRRFPGLELSEFIIAPDPAASNRQPNDESTIVADLRKHYQVSIESNNRLPLRLNAIDHYMTRMVDGGPGILIDERNCPVLARALKGGWRYALDKNQEMKGDAKPDKNPYSHSGDGFGYLCRYFHRQEERDGRYYQAAGGKKFVPPRTQAVRYHFT